ncbi:hypothetical protein [Kingella negevensis]|uniref:terminase small subunit-like protein n=1 Tax=Kingella negevensis TaxID=1522312 RepID=UPI0005C4A92D|nr:hypothetical protein [Kingella negevensis]MDK4688510.1 hypothetical protein [Kingella negevensis]WII91755.1 hypothetical protein QEO93_04000 [Kingella negevensis]
MSEKTKRPVGRPSIYTDELAKEICKRIADGESLRAICRDEHMPHRDTVRTWLNESSKFSAQYARARELQADYFVDEIIEIADNANAESSVEVQKAKLRIDTRKWAAEKLSSKAYGAKVEVKRNTADLSDEELAAELARYGIKQP